MRFKRIPWPIISPQNWLILTIWCFSLSIYIGIYFGCASLAALTFSRCSERGRFSNCGVWGFHRWLFLSWSLGFRVRGLQGYGSQALEHRLGSCSAQDVALQHTEPLGSGINPCLLHWQSELLPPSHQGSPVLSSVYCVNVCMSCTFFFNKKEIISYYS